VGCLVLPFLPSELFLIPFAAGGPRGWIVPGHLRVPFFFAGKPPGSRLRTPRLLFFGEAPSWGILGKPFGDRLPLWPFGLRDPHHLHFLGAAGLPFPKEALVSLRGVGDSPLPRVTFTFSGRVSFSSHLPADNTWKTASLRSDGRLSFFFAIESGLFLFVLFSRRFFFFLSFCTPPMGPSTSLLLSSLFFSFSPLFVVVLSFFLSCLADEPPRSPPPQFRGEPL